MSAPPSLVDTTADNGMEEVVGQAREALQAASEALARLRRG